MQFYGYPGIPIPQTIRLAKAHPFPMISSGALCSCQLATHQVPGGQREKGVKIHRKVMGKSGKSWGKSTMRFLGSTMAAMDGRGLPGLEKNTTKG